MMMVMRLLLEYGCAVNFAKEERSDREEEGEDSEGRMAV